jgi:hypothetical protein
MKYLKSYKLFEEKNYEFGCIMLDIPVKNWNEITSFIDTNDIYTLIDNDTYGIQGRPHLTLLYPVLNNVTFEEVEKILNKIINKKIVIEIDKIDIFENEKFDVVKFNVKNNDYLNTIHEVLKINIPNGDKYDIYKPHITISYLEKGKSEKYKREYNHSLTIDKITYINSDGLENYFYTNFN